MGSFKNRRNHQWYDGFKYLQFTATLYKLPFRLKIMNVIETIEPLFSGIPWMIVYSGEGLLILTGNSVAAFIFMKIRNNLKRMSYLLISLTVADLLLGISISWHLWEGIAVMGQKCQRLCGKNRIYYWSVSLYTASLLSLSLISLERMFAIFWPFRHRWTTLALLALFGY